MKCESIVLGVNEKTGKDVMLDFTDIGTGSSVINLKDNDTVTGKKYIKDLMDGQHTIVHAYDIVNGASTVFDVNKTEDNKYSLSRKECIEDLKKTLSILIEERRKVLEYANVKDFNMFNKVCTERFILKRHIFCVESSSDILDDTELYDVFIEANKNTGFGVNVLLITSIIGSSVVFYPNEVFNTVILAEDGIMYQLDLESGDIFTTNFKEREVEKSVFPPNDREMYVATPYSNVTVGGSGDYITVTGDCPVGLIMPDNMVLSKTPKKIIDKFIYNNNNYNSCFVVNVLTEVRGLILRSLKERLACRPTDTTIYIAYCEQVDLDLVAMVYDFGKETNIGIIFITEQDRIYYDQSREEVAVKLMDSTFRY